MTIANGDPRPSRAEARWFGLLLLAVFCILGALLGWQLGSPRFTQVMGGIGLLLAVFYYAVPPLRVPLFLAWMALTMPLGRLISTVILALIYFLVLTPTAWFTRAVGRDPLQRKPDPSAESYWAAYNPGENQDRYFRQS